MLLDSAVGKKWEPAVVKIFGFICHQSDKMESLSSSHDQRR